MIFYPKYVEQGKWAYRDGGFLSSESSKIQKFNEVADYVAKSGSKSKMHGSEPFITVPYASCVSKVKD